MIFIADSSSGYLSDKISVSDGLVSDIVDNNGSKTLEIKLDPSYGGLDSFLRRDETSVPTQDQSFDLGSSDYKWNNIYAVTFQGNAVTATYADIAEKYSSKDELEIGHVVVISSDDNYDVELSNELNSNKFIGITSFNPAFKMNSELDKGYYIGLKGRVPCKVIGPVKKGDPLITYRDGTAISIFNEKCKEILNFNIIAKALETTNLERDLIEVSI